LSLVAPAANTTASRAGQACFGQIEIALNLAQRDIVDDMLIAQANDGRRGMKLKPKPTSTRTTGYGNASLRATKTAAATRAKRKTMVSA
jgi:hypothetical protein